MAGRQEPHTQAHDHRRQYFEPPSKRLFSPGAFAGTLRLRRLIGA